MPNPGAARDYKAEALSKLLDDFDYHLLLINFTPEFVAIADTDIAANTFNVVNTLAEDSIVRFESVPANLSVGLSLSLDYYVVNSTTSRFQVALTSGGDPVEFSGGGNFNVVEQSLRIPDNQIPMAQIAKHEVLRTPVDPGAVPVGARAFGGVQTNYVPFQITAPQSLNFTHYVLTFGSTDTAFSAQGGVAFIRDMNTPQLIRNAQTITIPIRFAYIQKAAGSVEDN